MPRTQKPKICAIFPIGLFVVGFLVRTVIHIRFAKFKYLNIIFSPHCDPLFSSLRSNEDNLCIK